MNSRCDIRILDSCHLSVDSVSWAEDCLTVLVIQDCFVCKTQLLSFQLHSVHNFLTVLLSSTCLIILLSETADVIDCTLFCIMNNNLMKRFRLLCTSAWTIAPAFNQCLIGISLSLLLCGVSDLSVFSSHISLQITNVGFFTAILFSITGLEWLAGRTYF